MPKFSHFFALPIFALPFLAGSLVLSAFGQGGATHPGMSMYAQPSYDGVEREVLNPKTNSWESQHGYLMFDAKEQVKFINNNGNQFKLPYKAIKALEFNFYNPVAAKRSTIPMNVKLGGKRYLTIRFDLGSGLESTVMALEADQYQQVMGTFRSKTGLQILRPGAGYEKHW